MKFELKPNNRNPDKNDVLRDIKVTAEKLGKDSLKVSEYNKFGRWHADTPIRLFGKWNEALKLAGLKIAKRMNIPDEELFENILNVWTHYGRQPSYGEMEKSPSVLSPQIYKDRFGSWRKALETFVEKINQEDDKEKTTEDKPVIKKRNDIKNEKTINNIVQNGEARSINLSLRYKVLSRDNFRCVRCGRSPATNPGVELHVDHKQPFSKQGKTIIENLETKCKECNLGKSNRHIE